MSPCLPDEEAEDRETNQKVCLARPGQPRAITACLLQENRLTVVSVPGNTCGFLQEGGAGLSDTRCCGGWTVAPLQVLSPCCPLNAHDSFATGAAVSPTFPFRRPGPIVTQSRSKRKCCHSHPGGSESRALTQGSGRASRCRWACGDGPGPAQCEQLV